MDLVSHYKVLKELSAFRFMVGMAQQDQQELYIVPDAEIKKNPFTNLVCIYTYIYIDRQ